MSAAYTKVSVPELPNLAEGRMEGLAVRAVREPSGAEQTGAMLHQMDPGVRQAFGHVHHEAEELFYVVTGSGQVNLGDTIEPLSAGDLSNNLAVKVLKSEGGAIPFSGARPFADQQQAAFGRATMGTFGEDAARMTPEVLKTLIANGESLEVEFKGEAMAPFNDRDLVEAAFPRLPFMWLATESGDAGVFMLHARDLP